MNLHIVYFNTVNSWEKTTEVNLLNDIRDVLVACTGVGMT